MTKILFYLAIICLFSHVISSDSKRFLADARVQGLPTGLVFTEGEEALLSEEEFGGDYEWDLIFQDNGETVVINTIDGTWTVEGIDSETANAVIDRASPLAVVVAGSLGVDTTPVVGAITNAADNVGSDGFNSALSDAVDEINTAADSIGMNPSDLNSAVSEGTSQIGESGTVKDVSGATTEDVNNAVDQAVLSVAASSLN